MRALFFMILVTGYFITHAQQVATGDSLPLAFPDSAFNGKSNTTTATDTLLKNDSTKTTKAMRKHSAARAVILSAILPGLGQAYNRKYWKIPIIYTGFVGLGYCIYYTATNYNGARAAYRDAVDGDPTTNRTYLGSTNSGFLKAQRDYYNRYLTLSCIATIVWYALNLVDAAVDGHLYHYNMSDKLSLSVDPDFRLPAALPSATSSFGLKLTVRM